MTGVLKTQADSWRHLPCGTSLGSGSFIHQALSSCHTPGSVLGADVATESNSHQSLVEGDGSPVRYHPGWPQVGS